MARSINISTDVYARIWSLRQPGEETEDDILRRELKCGGSSASDRRDGRAAEVLERPGFVDDRFGFRVENGFTISRVFRGQLRKAIASNGTWRLEGDGGAYSSLNELSHAVGAGRENAWANWFFVDGSGRRQPISSLRKASLIVRRPRK